MFVETASDARTYRPKVTKTLEQARRGPSRAVGSAGAVCGTSPTSTGVAWRSSELPR
jgi:hypothetical protein